MLGKELVETRSLLVWHPAKDISTHKPLFQMFHADAAPMDKFFRGYCWVLRGARTTRVRTGGRIWPQIPRPTAPGKTNHTSSRCSASCSSPLLAVALFSPCCNFRGCQSTQQQVSQHNTPSHSNLLTTKRNLPLCIRKTRLF